MLEEVVAQVSSRKMNVGAIGLHGQRQPREPGVGAGPIKVADKLDPAITKIARPFPVVDQVIPEIDHGLGERLPRRSERRMAIATAGEEVVVQCHIALELPPGR